MSNRPDMEELLYLMVQRGRIGSLKKITWSRDLFSQTQCNFHHSEHPSPDHIFKQNQHNSAPNLRNPVPTHLTKIARFVAAPDAGIRHQPWNDAWNFAGCCSTLDDRTSSAPLSRSFGYIELNALAPAASAENRTPGDAVVLSDLRELGDPGRLVNLASGAAMMIERFEVMGCWVAALVGGCWLQRH